VRSIIAELDEPPPQVMIQVVLAEVTIDSDTQWGMDISAGPFGGEEARASSTFGLSGAAIAATALGVPNLSVSTTDFSLLIRALESQGRLEVLSRPQIVAANNEPARLQVGERVSLPTDVRVNDNGSVNSTIEQEDLGIILDVTPSVNDDGFVRLEVKPTFSNLTTRTTQVSEDFEAPVISVREIETVVTVKDGQTVVIGGLIENRVERRKSKVPLLGDVPILGIPFQAELTQRNRTELLVLLTPRVLRQPGSADEVTRIELDRMGMPPERRDILRRGDFVDDIPIDVDLENQFRDHDGTDDDEDEGATATEGSDDGVAVRPAQIYGVK
jgi:general secretion pathway protein D